MQEFIHFTKSIVNKNNQSYYKKLIQKLFNIQSLKKTKMNAKCLLGFHKWQKYGGPSNVGGGKFEQKFKCSKCGKIKYSRK